MTLNYLSFVRVPVHTKKAALLNNNLEALSYSKNHISCFFPSLKNPVRTASEQQRR